MKAVRILAFGAVVVAVVYVLVRKQEEPDTTPGTVPQPAAPGLDHA